MQPAIHQFYTKLGSILHIENISNVSRSITNSHTAIINPIKSIKEENTKTIWDIEQYKEQNSVRFIKIRSRINYLQVTSPKVPTILRYMYI